MRRVAFHSENGPGIGGSDIVMGAIADQLDRAAWDLYALVRPDYPTGVVFRRNPCPTMIGDEATVNSSNAAFTRGDPRTSTQPQKGSVGWAKRACLRLVPFGVRRRFGYRRCVARVRDTLKANRIEIFQTMDGGPQPTVVGARQAGCKVVAVYNALPPEEPIDRLTRLYSRRSARAADARVGVSRHCIELWARFLNIDPNEFRLIYNGVDVEDNAGIDPARVRAELGIPLSATVVGMTGRMTAEKGPTVFARAAVLVARAHPDVLFFYTGSGAELPAVEQIFREAGLGDRVRLLGFRPDAPRVTAAYDVAVVPSVVPESFGLVVIEAMAWAKPVIGSRTGGIPEIIVDGKTGRLVEPGDPGALARSLAELLSSPPRRREMGRAGFERVTQQFTRKTMLTGYEELYRELLAGAPQRSGGGPR